MDAIETAALPRIANLDIGGRQFDTDSPALAEALADAHRRQLRPRCLCRPGGIEMYVARLGGGHIVKRMPDSGSAHDPACPSFEPDAYSSGLGQLIGSAIVEDLSTGATTLKLDFALSVQPGRQAPTGQGAPAGTVRNAGARLTLRSLLHYLWHQAELARWHPGLAGLRNWRTVRRQLLQAAAEMVAGGATLASRLYVPEVFSVEQKDQIAGRRCQHWASSAVRPGRPQPLLLLIGEVKEIVPGRHGYRAVIKHVPDVAFAMDEQLYRRIETRFADELALWNASEGIRMIVIAAFGLNETGLPYIAGLYLMTVTRHWLPVENAAEWQLVDRLVDDQRAFLKVLRYDLRRDTPLASVALTDRGDPTPLLYAGSANDIDPHHPDPNTVTD